MPYTPTLEDELMRLRYEDCLVAVESAPAVWKDSPPEVRDYVRRLEDALADVREAAAMLGPDAYEYITGERLELFLGEEMSLARLGEPIAFYSVAVWLGDPHPLLVHGASTCPLPSDVESALAYCRSLGYTARNVRSNGMSEDGSLCFLEMC